jgi:glycosyltransferase involved in cell wall biosynthesis
VREGALAGLTIIASRLGGLQEAVEEGAAIGFKGRDPADLAVVLARVLSDADLRNEMSRKAALVCDLEKSVLRMEEIYDFARRSARGDSSNRPPIFPGPPPS